ncbi:MAG: hypothetical protein ABIJ45_00700 [Candidatus Zixiibacteriota bacterium]
MIRIIVTLLAFLLIFTIFGLNGCDKEKIVTSTEYVEKIEYVEVGGDTIYLIDTVYSHDSTVVSTTDTVYQTSYIHDTIFSIDTVITQINHYDTVVITDIDTVTITQPSPSAGLAFSAMQSYSDGLVLDAINAEFGISDGWVFYLSVNQIDLSTVSSSVYDIYGYIDYWTTDWSGFYAFEFYWRMTYKGGDPTNPANWTLSEPPSLSPTREPGLMRIDKTQADNSNY